MLEKKIVLDQIMVNETRIVHVRESTVILEDGVELSRSFRRWTLSPGEDLSDQDPLVVKICQAAWEEINQA